MLFAICNVSVVCVDSTHVVVDDERDVGHVDTTPSEIGRDHDVRVTIAQGLERGLALLLVLVRVHRRRRPPRALQLLGEHVAGRLQCQRGRISVNGPSDSRSR